MPMVIEKRFHILGVPSLFQRDNTIKFVFNTLLKINNYDRALHLLRFNQKMAFRIIIGGVLTWEEFKIGLRLSQGGLLE